MDANRFSFKNSDFSAYLQKNHMFFSKNVDCRRKQGVATDEMHTGKDISIGRMLFCAKETICHK